MMVVTTARRRGDGDTNADPVAKKIASQVGTIRQFIVALSNLAGLFGHVIFTPVT
jgi:hypothetical protein